LLEKLAKAKAEAQTQKVDVADVIDEKPTIPPLPHSKSDPTSASNGGVRSAVLARLRLKLKLASEKKSYVFNQNESRAQALRAQILEARARRQATETDAVLRHMDKLDRAREVRRRLMVAKMMAAETESERRARELKDKLMGEKKARMLKEQLKKRKQSHGEVDAGVGTLVNGVQVAVK
jgi:E3 ubiquitin-protein ligase Topors